MANWSDIATWAVQELTAQSQTDRLDAAEETSVLGRCKLMLDTWVYDGYISPGLERRVLTITDSRQTYTVGPGSDIATPLVPLTLRSVTYQPAGYVDYRPLSHVDLRGYLNRRTVLGTFPWAFYYETLPDGSQGTIYFNSPPYLNDSFEIRWHRFFLPAGVLDPEATLEVPVGYPQLIMLSLADEMVNVYHVHPYVRRDLSMKLNKLRAKILFANRPIVESRVDPVFLEPGLESRSFKRVYRWR